VATMPAFTNILNKIEKQNQAVVAASMAAQQSMMKLSMGLGALSMAFGMNSKNAEHAKISTILMTMSMIPATIQMFQMTAKTMDLAKAQTTAKLTTQGLTTSVKTLAKSLGPILIIFGLVSSFVYLTKNQFEEADDAMLSFAQSASYTSDQYKELQEQFANTDAGNLARKTESTTEKRIDLEKQLADTTDETNRKVIQARLDLLLQEEAIMKDILNLEASRQLLDNGGDAERIFNLSKELQAAEKAEAAAKKEKGYLYIDALDMKLPAGYLGKKAGLMGGPDQDKYVQDFTNDTKAALAAIPLEYQGAIADIAKASDDVEEFMAGVAQFAEESGLEFGAIFGNMGDSIQDDFIGPIEAAKEAIFEFNSEREELFFGMSKGNLTGDMVKQVVNKGVETLINTTEVIMTNNFAGMTTQQAAKEITAQIVVELNGQGLNIKNNGLGF